MSDSAQQTQTTQPTNPTPTNPSLVTEGAPADPAAPKDTSQGDGGSPAVEASLDPEKLTLPEGFEKPENWDAVTKLFNDAKLPQDMAQKMVDMGAGLVKSATEKMMAGFQQINDNWQKEVKADPEVGGTKLPEVLQTIASVVNNTELTDPKFKEALDVTGAGNHPAVVRTLHKWAKALSEGKPIAGSPPARDGNGRVQNEPRSIAEAMYGPSGPHTGGPRLG